MRPVDKGTAPRTYNDYKQARDDLIDRIGCTCSYCEMNISNMPEVEHVQPKSKNPALRSEWNNFLLSCKYCNTIKSDDNNDRLEYLFPDEDNTAVAFNYLPNNEVKRSDSLSDPEKVFADNTLNLMKLNRKFDTSGKRDMRWFSRQQVWGIAQDSLNDFLQLPEQNMINQIVRGISSNFSVWLTVFKDYPEVKNAIINGVKGTAANCFDKDGNPIKGVRGKI